MCSAWRCLEAIVISILTKYLGTFRDSIAPAGGAGTQPPVPSMTTTQASAPPLIPSQCAPTAPGVHSAIPTGVPPGRPPKQSKAFPKRALNPYLVFLRKHEPRVRADQPELNNTQVTRHLATMWRNVSAEERVCTHDSLSVTHVVAMKKFPTGLKRCSSALQRIALKQCFCFFLLLHRLCTSFAAQELVSEV